MSSEINFYSTTNEWGEFSNFANYKISLDGKVWPTTEHYFQAQKFEDQAYKEKIRHANTAMIAARMGRDRKYKLRKDWESVKESIMYKAVLAKFSQHEKLKDLLLSTGDAHLIENSNNDHYWGNGGDGSGKNRLGLILMKVRQELLSKL